RRRAAEGGPAERRENPSAMAAAAETARDVCPHPRQVRPARDLGPDVRGEAGLADVRHQVDRQELTASAAARAAPSPSDLFRPPGGPRPPGQSPSPAPAPSCSRHAPPPPSATPCPLAPAAGALASGRPVARRDRTGVRLGGAAPLGPPPLPRRRA